MTAKDQSNPVGFSEADTCPWDGVKTNLNVPLPSIEVRKAFVNLLRLLNASRLMRSQKLIENESVVPALVNRLVA